MTAKRRGGLGQGLGALIQPETPSPAGGIVNLPIETIERNPHQPRVHFEEAQLDELARSIGEHGILQPLIVTRSNEHEQRYQLIAGERRWRAAQRAGLSEVPAVIKEATEQEALVLALVENIQRADLDPIEEARAYLSLANEFRLTHDEIGKRVGKSRSAVTNALRLLKLPEPMKQAVREGRLSAGHIRALMTFDEELLQAAIDQIETYRLNVRETEAMAQLVQRERITPAQARKTIQQQDAKPRRAQARNAAVEPDASRTLSVDDQFVEDRLRTALDTKVELRRQGVGGKIIIEFYNDEQLEGLYQRLVGQE